MVAGVAFLDYDGDGYMDIYLVGGAAIPSLKKESPVYWNRLFHNNHDGTFTDVTEKAGVAGTGYRMGQAVRGDGHKREPDKQSEHGRDDTGEQNTAGEACGG